jgi:hypothetical protein
MPTPDPRDWAPALLTAPDGRTHTPGSLAEHNQLMANGYRIAEQPAPATPADPAPMSQADTGQAAADTDANKTKTNRRNGGAQ